ncbi:MAG: NAD-dependent epimerase/dehydratase family protein [Gemmatimonadaceae bacterium]
MTPLHVVLGAHGNAGQALVRALRTRGERVRGVSRHDEPDPPEGVEWIVADLMNPADQRRIFDGSGVVYLAAQPLYTRWSEEFLPLVERVLAGTQACGARLVHVDNAYMYGQVAGELSETLPPRPASAKGRIRAQVADRLLSAHAAGQTQVAIGRASDFFGPRVGGSVVGDALFSDVLGGRTPRWLGSLDVPHTLSYIEDVARALVTLGTDERSWGEVWHLPAAPAITGREFLRLACLAANRPVAAGAHSRLAMTVAGWFSAIVREVSRELYQWERPWILNADKFQRVFGPFAPTPIELAIEQTVAWYRDAWDDQVTANV